MEAAREAVSPASAPSAEEERPRATGIGGSVLEKGGEPAAGVLVRLRARRIFKGAPGSASPLSTTTDDRGGFAFGAVADGEYEVFTEKDQRYERASTLVRAGADAVVLIVDPLSKGWLSIRGVVERAAGGTLSGVSVEVIGESSLAAKTDGRGAYALRVPAGARVEQTALRFRHDGYRDRRWVVTEGVRSGEREVIGNVQLDPDAAGVSVIGLVSSANGAPVPGASVQLDSAARRRSYRALTDDAGRFLLEDVETASDYRLWARPRAGFKDGVLENVRVERDATELEIAVTPIGVGTLSGRMVSPDGAPVSGFTMYLTAAYGSGARSLAVTGDAQGRFVVRDLPEGPVTLQTRAAPVMAVSGLEVSAGAAARDVIVVVDAGPHRLDGRLVTSDGEPAPGARVSLEWSTEAGGVTSRSSRETITGADGTFQFTQLGAGAHVVSAAFAAAGGVRVEHAVGAGTEPLQLRLPAKRGRQ
jgi:hypothetical protein